MDEDILPPSLIETIDYLWSEALSLVQMFVTPGWRQNQILIVLGLAAVSFVLHKLTEPMWQDWARSREGWPKWRLRMLVQVRQRLGLIYFVLMASAVYVVMQQVTWPSRSYLIGVAASLAAAWLAIGFVSRLVRNRTLRRVISWSLWIYATLYAFNLHDDVAAYLDGLAISFGDMTLSVLAIIKALILIGVLLTLARLFTQSAAAGLRRNEDISPSMQELATKAVQVLAYGFVFMTGIRALGFDLTGLAFLSGAIGVGIGFGLQKVVSNLISGIIILLDKSIKPGDVISLGETFGWINSLGARYVSVVTRAGKE